MRRSTIDRPSREVLSKEPGERTRATRRNGVSVSAAMAAPVGEMTYRRVRADIVYGRLAPGQKLTALQTQHPVVTSVRGAGLMRGLELSVDASPVIDFGYLKGFSGPAYCG